MQQSATHVPARRANSQGLVWPSKGATRVQSEKGTALRVTPDEKSRIEIPNSPSLNLADTVTLDLWVKTYGSTGRWQGLLTKRNDHNGELRQVRVINTLAETIAERRKKGGDRAAMLRAGYLPHRFMADDGALRGFVEATVLNPAEKPAQVILRATLGEGEGRRHEAQSFSSRSTVAILLKRSTGSWAAQAMARSTSTRNSGSLNVQL
jgi:hypothetical protein